MLKSQRSDPEQHGSDLVIAAQVQFSRKHGGPQGPQTKVPGTRAGAGKKEKDFWKKRNCTSMM